MGGLVLFLIQSTDEIEETNNPIWWVSVRPIIVATTFPEEWVREIKRVYDRCQCGKTDEE